METEILEGTFQEVQKRFVALPLEPETRLRVVISEPLPNASPEPFIPIEFRNGVPLLPRRKLDTPLTLELIKQIDAEEDEEIINAYRTAGY